MLSTSPTQALPGWILTEPLRPSPAIPILVLPICTTTSIPASSASFSTSIPPEELESVNIEVDAAGKILKEWDLAQIISDAMTAGGDDPGKFVFPSPFDWFHNNATTYNRADDSLIVSSRENFVICIDYETGAIKWILGDTTKLWYPFPSLAQYALTLAPGSLPPIGQHASSLTYDQGPPRL